MFQCCICHVSVICICHEIAYIADIAINPNTIFGGIWPWYLINHDITCISLGNPAIILYFTTKQQLVANLYSADGATAELRDVFSRATERWTAAGGVTFPGRVSPGCPGGSRGDAHWDQEGSSSNQHGIYTNIFLSKLTTIRSVTISHQGLWDSPGYPLLHVRHTWQDFPRKKHNYNNNRGIIIMIVVVIDFEKLTI